MVSPLGGYSELQGLTEDEVEERAAASNRAVLDGLSARLGVGQFVDRAPVPFNSGVIGTPFGGVPTARAIDPQANDHVFQEPRSNVRDPTVSPGVGTRNTHHASTLAQSIDPDAIGSLDQRTESIGLRGDQSQRNYQNEIAFAVHDHHGRMPGAPNVEDALRGLEASTVVGRAPTQPTFTDMDQALGFSTDRGDRGAAAAAAAHMGATEDQVTADQRAHEDSRAAFQEVAPNIDDQLAQFDAEVAEQRARDNFSTNMALGVIGLNPAVDAGLTEAQVLGGQLAGAVGGLSVGQNTTQPGSIGLNDDETIADYAAQNPISEQPSLAAQLASAQSTAFNAANARDATGLPSFPGATSSLPGSTRNGLDAEAEIAGPNYGGQRGLTQTAAVGFDPFGEESLSGTLEGQRVGMAAGAFGTPNASLNPGANLGMEDINSLASQGFFSNDMGGFAGYAADNGGMAQTSTAEGTDSRADDLSAEAAGLGFGDLGQLGTVDTTGTIGPGDVSAPAEVSSMGMGFTGSDGIDMGAEDVSQSAVTAADMGSFDNAVSAAQAATAAPAAAAAPAADQSAPAAAASTAGADYGGTAATSVASRGGTGNANGGASGNAAACYIATDAVSNGVFSAMDKAKAELWCRKHLHGHWAGETVRLGYQKLARQAVATNRASRHYDEFRQFVRFGRGLDKSIKGAVAFYARMAQFFAVGLSVRLAATARSKKDRESH